MSLKPPFYQENTLCHIPVFGSQNLIWSEERWNHSWLHTWEIHFTEIHPARHTKSLLRVSAGPVLE